MSICIRVTKSQSDGTHLVRDMWPSMLAQLAENKRAWNELTDEDKVPVVLDDFMNWAYVRKMYAADPTRCFKLAHATGEYTGDVINQVAIRFQGFVLSSDLKPLGNWCE